MVLLRDGGGGAPPPPARPRARPVRPVRAGSIALPASSRNVFEYGAAAPVERSVRVPPPLAPILPPVAEAPAPAPAVRLVGLVRRAGVMKAALQVHGETMVVGAGETAGDYRVLGIDEDGVRLRASDGTTITLPAGGS
jgi:hypothetical protein